MVKKREVPHFPNSAFIGAGPGKTGTYPPGPKATERHQTGVPKSGRGFRARAYSDGPVTHTLSTWSQRSGAGWRRGLFTSESPRREVTHGRAGDQWLECREWAIPRPGIHRRSAWMRARSGWREV
ncbi:hypothetical protein EDB86DRAFT_2833029 [Lactarius hatsudake]|nr:hypothetical protein EDB86DRAFT_2833029 [Lactarius hatsudake]